MAVHADLLRKARAAEDRLVDAERSADIARAEFRHAVHRLHLAGSSLREIADALGLSHQRVHQIIGEAGGARPGYSRTLLGKPDHADLLKCSFCGKSQRQVKKLIAGPQAYICDQCIGTADRVIDTGESAATPLFTVTSAGEDVPTVKCSFCGKRRHQVSGLAAAAGVAICNECLELCHEILTEEVTENPPDTESS